MLEHRPTIRRHALASDSFDDTNRIRKFGRPSEEQIRHSIGRMNQSGKAIDQIVDALFDEHYSDKQMDFYPFVADLFTISGMKCSESRAGDNGARWDAMIDDEVKSIPVEIKSPTEEEHLSLKAVRQALENKVVLLARQTHKTDRETTTLAVGYKLPNDRAEVKQLVADIFAAYGVRVGVIGLKELLRMAVVSAISGRPVKKDSFQNSIGVVEVAV